jgi:hypothetical protein
MLQILLFILMISSSVQAQVYRCQTDQSPPRYQDKPCSSNQTQQEIAIQPQDNAKIQAAQEKLNQERQQQQRRQQERDRQRLETRKVDALEAQARHTQSLQQTIQEQTQTPAPDRSENDNLLYYPNYPVYPPNRPRPNRLPIKKQLEINNNFSADPMNPPLRNDTRLYP